MAMSPIAIRTARDGTSSGGCGSRKITNWFKAAPSVMWLIERAPTEGFMMEILHQAHELASTGKASDKTARKWAQAAEARIRWLKIHPPTFEKIGVEEFVKGSEVEVSTYDGEGFAAQRAGKTMEDCPYVWENADADFCKKAQPEDYEAMQDKETEWRAGFLRAQDTPAEVVDDRPKVKVGEFVVDAVNAEREWFCATNGIFTFEGPNGKPISSNEYFLTKF